VHWPILCIPAGGGRHGEAANLVSVNSSGGLNSFHRKDMGADFWIVAKLHGLMEFGGLLF
jgi:hypothetical protein